MNALLILHVENEGPGILGSFLENKGVELVTKAMFRKDQLPDDLGEFRAIISMGGPMNVYDEAEYPFLKDETELLAKGIELGMPILGVCLGAQMIAKAAGADVVKADQEEIGWTGIWLTQRGKQDELFTGIQDPEFEVFQWHGDTFHLPDNGSLLAEGALCRNQAFRVSNAYGLQFHVEATGAMISQWFMDSELRSGMLQHYESIKPLYEQRAEILFSNFFRLMNDFRQLSR